MNEYIFSNYKKLREVRRKMNGLNNLSTPTDSQIAYTRSNLTGVYDCYIASALEGYFWAINKTHIRTNRSLLEDIDSNKRIYIGQYK